MLFRKTRGYSVVALSATNFTDPKNKITKVQTLRNAQQTVF